MLPLKAGNGREFTDKAFERQCKFRYGMRFCGDKFKQAFLVLYQAKVLQNLMKVALLEFQWVIGFNTKGHL